MNPRNTWIWVAVAASLFAFIFFYERHAHKPVSLPSKVLAGFKGAEVTSVQVLPKGQSTIQAERATNGVWYLAGQYPAQAARIEQLLMVLERLVPAKLIGDDLPDADQRFGFESPQSSLILGPKNEHILIGDKTAPGDQVFVQVVGVPGVFVVDATWLNYVPQSAVEWRQRALADWSRLPFDRLIVTNAGKVLELQVNVTNGSWSMNAPVRTRADHEKVESALQRLIELNAREFVSDDPRPDLDSFGLLTPDLSLAFFQRTNRMLLIEFGKSPTNDTSLAYARRVDQNSVVTVPRHSVDPWLASHSDNFREFMDRHLLALTRVPDSMEVRTQDNSFTLSLQTNGWRVLPRDSTNDFPADLILLQMFVSSLVNLQYTEIAKEIVPAQDLSDYGLATPVRQIILRTVGTNDTESSSQQVDFGFHEGKFYARNVGESFVYAVTEADLAQLPTAGWQMRDRRVWTFTQNTVTRVGVHQGGKVRELNHKGTNSWTFAAGSQGIIDEIISAAVEETVFRLGELRAAVWVQRGDQNREAFGFEQTDYQITVELNGGEKLNLVFGKEAPSHSPYAAAVLNGETWIFEFPWPLFQYVQKYLSIPADIH